MSKVLEIWQNNTTYSPTIRQNFYIMLKRDLTDEEQLLLTFGDGTDKKKITS